MRKVVPGLVGAAAGTAMFGAWGLACALLLIGFMVHLILDSLKPNVSALDEIDGDDSLMNYSGADFGSVSGDLLQSNPATGLLMVGGVDVAGNMYGASDQSVLIEHH